MILKRLFQHLFVSPFLRRKWFPQPTLEKITAAVKESEAKHSGQIAVVIEEGLELFEITGGLTSNNRAKQVFSELNIWDTELNNGVLFYLLLADHQVEIVADRGIHAKVGTAGWEKICHHVEEKFKQKNFLEGALEGINLISKELEIHFPGSSKNELPDSPVVLK